jgi:hypothetical protein
MWCGEGDAETEGGSLAFLALNPDLAAVGLDNMLGNSQSQPAPLSGTGLICFKKTLKDMRQIIGRDAYSGVSYLKEARLV